MCEKLNNSVLIPIAGPLNYYVLKTDQKNSHHLYNDSIRQTFAKNHPSVFVVVQLLVSGIDHMNKQPDE